MIWIFGAIVGIILLIGYCIVRMGAASDEANDHLLEELMKGRNENDS